MNNNNTNEEKWYGKQFKTHDEARKAYVEAILEDSKIADEEKRIRILKLVEALKGVRVDNQLLGLAQFEVIKELW